MRLFSSLKVSSKNLGSFVTTRKLSWYLLSLTYSPPLVKKLSNLREEARDYLVDNRMAVPKLPLWGKNNNPEEWWNVNDFEIISVAYEHEVEGFLKIIAPYFPKGSKTEEMEDYEPHTPPGFSGPRTSIAEPPAP